LVYPAGSGREEWNTGTRKKNKGDGGERRGITFVRCLFLVLFYDMLKL
jgi:hypothetical protein